MPSESSISPVFLLVPLQRLTSGKRKTRRFTALNKPGTPPKPCECRTAFRKKRKSGENYRTE